VRTGWLTAIAAGSHSDRHQELVGIDRDGTVWHSWNWLCDDGLPNWQAWSTWDPWHAMPPVR
jgi:hypothetical protein